MRWRPTMFVLAAAFLAVFLEASAGLPRKLLGAQIDLLPALMVYAALTLGFATIVLLAVCGGLWFDSLSLNPLGASVLPLLLIGLLIYRSRDLLMREHVFAQAVLGVMAGAAQPLGTLFILLNAGVTPLLGWVSLWRWAVMAAGCGALTPVCFKLFDRLRRALEYQPVTQTSFRPAGRSKGGGCSMFVFDMFKEEGGRLQVIAGVVTGGMLLLLGGLWFVQIVCAKQFETDLQKQSIRHVRTPAIRGRILDRNGLPLADDKPRYNAILYLEDLQPQFGEEYLRLRNEYVRAHPEAVNPKGKIILPAGVKQRLQLAADCSVVSNITYGVSRSLAEPRALNTSAFLRHYTNYPYVPFQIVPDLAPKQVAILAEQWSGQPAIELETQPERVYPNRSLAAHLLGFVRRRDSLEGGQFAFDMPDYQGASGVEYVYDDALRGQPGDKSVLINNMNYRQHEEIETPNQPGKDIFLTIDLAIQKAAEKALAEVEPNARGAVVVMNPNNGDILALVSAPTFDPNIYVSGLTPEESKRLEDPKYTPQFNRAVTGYYPPGSTFKIITGLACLEDGLDPNYVFDSPGEYLASPTARPIGDTAGAGPFNFERAFYRSSNTYFIVMGKDRLRKILEVARRFHLGEKTGISTRQEVEGNFPQVPAPGMSAPDICIGQEITATPLQMAGMISVIANGGTLYVPRVVSYSRSPDTGETEQLVAPGQVRDHVQINPHFLELIRHAMLQDTEHAPDGGAYPEFHENGAPYLGNFRVAGKTGTAEVKSARSPYRKITWFDSYGPYENPRYVVVVMVEDGASGGKACAPVARKIYQAILKREQAGQARPPTLARN